MRTETATAKRAVDWAVASCQRPGESMCGDWHIVKADDGGVLASVIDGLGHGQEARAAAETAARILEDHADWPLEALVRRCHEALINTRGATMTLARIDVLSGNTASPCDFDFHAGPQRLREPRHPAKGLPGQLTWMAIGNVEGVVLRSNSPNCAKAEHILLQSGLVGYQLPPLQSSSLTIIPGDLLVIVTDGISPEFQETLVPSDSPQQIADAILKRHFKGTDDALALVLRYIGHGPT